MRLTLLCCVLACVAAAAPPAYDHRELMVYRDATGAMQPVRSADDWRRRREHILLGMQEAMGPLPEKSDADLDVKVLETRETDRYQQLKITFLAAPSNRVPAWLLLPKNALGKLPAMLALHQTTSIGKDEPAGLGPNENLDYGRELAERGYVVLAPDYPSFGEYEYDFDNCPLSSGTIQGIFNHMRCVDLLVARTEVDPGRIGAIGHSLGGHNSLFVAAFDERLKVVVSSCGWTPFHDYYGGKLEGWTSPRYMPRIKNVYDLDPDRVPFDFYEVVAAIAPRAFFSCSPQHDENFDVEGVKKGIAAAEKVYAIYGAADQLQASYPDSEHDFPPDVRQQAYEFIDRVLEHSPKAQTPRGR